MTDQRNRKAELKQRFSTMWGEGEEPTAEKPASPPATAGAETDEPPPPLPATPAPARTGPPTRQRQTPRKAPQKPAGKKKVASMPIAQQADTARPQRLMVPLSVDEDRTLKQLRVEDAIPAAARIRAMLQIYRSDPRYRRKVDAAARSH